MYFFEESIWGEYHFVDDFTTQNNQIELRYLKNYLKMILD